MTLASAANWRSVVAVRLSLSAKSERREEKRREEKSDNLPMDRGILASG